MARLNSLNDWITEGSGFSARRSAQDYTCGPRLAMAAAGSACGAGDDGKKQPAPAPKPAACGSGCGAGDDGKKKPEPAPKPSACGAGGR